MTAIRVQESESMYTQLGGEAAIEVAVDDFYNRVLADQTLAPIFSGVNLDTLRRHQVRFFSMALGGPNGYTGRAMRLAHAGLGITAAHFAAVAGHLGDALAAVGVPPVTVSAIIGLIAPLEPEIVSA